MKGLTYGWFWNNFNPNFKRYGRLCPPAEETNLFMDQLNLYWDNFEEDKESSERTKEFLVGCENKFSKNKKS